MKNLKFRAWLKKEKKMREIAVIDFELDGVWVQYSKNHNVFKDFEEIELMMRTNIKDKNNQLIYEGDIIRDREGKLYTVIWINEFEAKHTFNIRGHEETRYFTLAEKDSYSRYIYEIVGNIYENKELLEG